MNSTPGRQGTVKSNAGETWYETHGGAPSSRHPPIIVVHGGPGMTHDYLLNLSQLGRDREIIFYDQIGNGRSHPVGAGAEPIVSLAFLVEELEGLLAALTGIAGYVLLAHSSGGCVALEHALRQPAGLKAMILADTFPSGPMMQAGLRSRRDQLPPLLSSALVAGPDKDAAYAEALGEFFARFVCRVPPSPELLRTLTASSAFPHVQHKLMGKDLFNWDGPLGHWSVLDRLSEIGVPTLALAGFWDETGPECLEALAAGLPDCARRTFDHSSHLPHIEEPQACLTQIEQFLERLQ